MLRLGCAGCLVAIVVGTLVLGVGWSLLQITRPPDIATAAGSATDGQRAQQKLFDLARRPRTVELSEREVNAFLNRHLVGAADLPLQNLAAAFTADDHARIGGQITMRRLLAQPPLSVLAGIAPAAVLDRPVWLTIEASVSLEKPDASPDRRRLRLDVRRCWLGRLPLPEVMLRVLLDVGALRFLRTPIPDSIDDLRIERGRLVIRSR